MVRDTFAKCDIQEDVFPKVFESLYKQFSSNSSYQLYPNVVPVLEYLHPKYKLAVVSNADNRLQTVLAQLGVDHFFSHIVTSEEAGAEKPSPRIFEYALQKAGLPPHLAVHVGDHPRKDYEAAHRAGMRALLFKPQVPAKRVAESDIIHDFRELLALL